MSIFDKAKFGDKFKTRDGRMAVYISHFYEEFRCFEEHGINHKLWIKDYSCPLRFYDDGKADFPNDGMYIVSRWEEPVDEEELKELADTQRRSQLLSTPQLKDIWKSGFIAGYKKGVSK